MLVFTRVVKRHELVTTNGVVLPVVVEVEAEVGAEVVVGVVAEGEAEVVAEVVAEVEERNVAVVLLLRTEAVVESG